MAGSMSYIPAYPGRKSPRHWVFHQIKVVGTEISVHFCNKRHLLMRAYICTRIQLVVLCQRIPINYCRRAAPRAQWRMPWTHCWLKKLLGCTRWIPGITLIMMSDVLCPTKTVVLWGKKYLMRCKLEAKIIHTRSISWLLSPRKFNTEAIFFTETWGDPCCL